MDLMAARRRILLAADPDLPPGYKRLSYIANDNRYAYINTGTVIDRDCVVTLTFNQPTTSDNLSIWGYRYAGSYSDGKNILIYVNGASRYITVGVKTGASGVGRTDCFNYNEKTTIVLDAPSNKIYVNGSQFTGNYDFSNGKAFNSNGTSGYAPYIFAYNNADSAGGYTRLCKVYGYRVERNGAKVQNLIPAINPSGTYGMYDTVSGQFFGSATFTGE